MAVLEGGLPSDYLQMLFYTVLGFYLEALYFPLKVVYSKLWIQVV